MAFGAYYTILISVTAILISVVVGLLVALPGLSENADGVCLTELMSK